MSANRVLLLSNAGGPVSWPLLRRPDRLHHFAYERNRYDGFPGLTLQNAISPDDSVTSAAEPSPFLVLSFTSARICS